MNLLSDAAPAAAVLLLLGLAIYLHLRYEDTKAAFVSAVVALLVGGAWYGTGSERAELATKLETARGEIATLAERPGERTFDPVARELMVRRLKDFVGPSAFVVANSSDPETVDYALQIVTALKEAGWRVPPSFGMTFQPIVLPGDDGARPGVVLGVLPEVPGDFTESLLRVLLDGGIDVVAGPHWPGTEHPISILVGGKREP